MPEGGKQRTGVAFGTKVLQGHAQWYPQKQKAAAKRKIEQIIMWGVQKEPGAGCVFVAKGA